MAQRRSSISSRQAVQGPPGEVVDELLGGLRSGMSYVGAATIDEFWKRATFVRQTEAGRKESRPERSYGAPEGLSP